ncbi:transglutaminase domain-containing protein [[Eubacterium] cellulosolvens]
MSNYLEIDAFQGFEFRILKVIILLFVIIGAIFINPCICSKNRWNVDYNNPESYLTPGLQSTISLHETIAELEEKFTNYENLEKLRELYLWIQRDFQMFKGGGKLIGKVTIDELLNKRELSGCSDVALVFSAVARYLGYPSVMVDTASITWAVEYKTGKRTDYAGHVFVETFVSSSWILIDPSSGDFIMDYNYSNPIIPIKTENEIEGFYVILKGKDMWDYGVESPGDLHLELKAFAESFDYNKIKIPSYKIENLESVTMPNIMQPTSKPTEIPIQDTNTNETKLNLITEFIINQLVNNYFLIVGVGSFILICLSIVITIKRRGA